MKEPTVKIACLTALAQKTQCVTVEPASASATWGGLVPSVNTVR